MKRPDKTAFSDLLFITLGLIPFTAGIYFFKLPNGFSTGGVTGVSILASKLLGGAVSPATFILVLNVALLLLGLAVLGRELAWKTAYCSLFYSAATFLLERFLPLDRPLTDQPFMELIYAMLLTAVGSAVLFHYGASSGGTDIVALILKKYTSIPIGTALFCVDAVIAASTLFVFDLKTGLYSILGLFMKAFVVDNLLESVNLCKYFTIITSHPKEIDQYILHTLHHSATEVRAVGVFSHEDKTMLLTVCRRMEAVRLKAAIKEIDPHAFIVVTNSSEIIGRGFRGV